jgi:hypothetical protein
MHFFRDEGTYNIPPPTIYYTRATSPLQSSSYGHPPLVISLNKNITGTRPLRRRKNSNLSTAIVIYGARRCVHCNVSFGSSESFETELTIFRVKILSHVHIDRSGNETRKIRLVRKDLKPEYSSARPLENSDVDPGFRRAQSDDQPLSERSGSPKLALIILMPTASLNVPKCHREPYSAPVY